MTPSGKYSLTSTHKKKLEIPASAEAYIFIWDNIDDSQCSELEEYIENDGFKVVVRDLEEDAGNGSKNYHLTAYKP